VGSDPGLDVVHQGDELGGGAAAVVDEVVGVHRADLDAADATGLAARGLDQPAGGVARRVAEHASDAAHRHRLAGVALLQRGREALEDRLGVVGDELERRLHDDRVAETTVAVARAEAVAAVHDDVAVAVDQRQRHEVLEGLAVAGAGVHRHGAAEQRRDAGQLLQAGEPGLLGGAQQARQRHARAGGDAVAVALDAVEALQVQHRAAHAVVGDDDVAAAAEHAQRQFALAAGAHRQGHVLLAERLQEPVGGPADAQVHVRREGDALADGAAHRCEAGTEFDGTEIAGTEFHIRCLQRCLPGRGRCRRPPTAARCRPDDGAPA
jgi:hypothetical protein